MHRRRTFSDMSIAESCIDTTMRSQTLIKRRPAADYLVEAEVNNILTNIDNTFSIVDSENILAVVEYLYNYLSKKHGTVEMKIIITEILSATIDNKHNFDTQYTIIYRPILKDIVPWFVDYLSRNQVTKKKFSLFRRK